MFTSRPDFAQISRSGGRGQHRLDIDATAAEFRLQALRQGQDIGFARAVGAKRNLRRQTHHRSDIDDRAFAAGEKPRNDRAGEAGDGGDVEANQPVHHVEIGVGEAAGRRDAGIVDEDADIVVVAKAGFDPRQIGALREIGAHDVDCDPSLGAQTRRELLHARLVPGHQDKIMPAPAKSVGVGRANSGGRAGDEDGWKLANHEANSF